MLRPRFWTVRSGLRKVNAEEVGHFFEQGSQPLGRLAGEPGDALQTGRTSPSPVLP